MYDSLVYKVRFNHTRIYMNIIEIIEKKRDREVLTKEEIVFFIEGYCHDKIKDYQASSLLMAICINGFNKAETFALCEAMIQSGDILDLSCVEGIKVDKHSSGGVGDKTTLALAPMLSACGLVVAKMSGRGLGHTGGTLDKLEAIKGFKVDLNEKVFIQQLQSIGLAIISQNEDMVLADKKLYALRDVSGTVASIPLIATSIMSKKIASGADYILLDVKYGDGAFMATKEQAEELARLMIEIGTHFQRQVKAEITSMEEPLGLAIGNALEVQEAIDTLLGKGPSDFTDLCVHSGGVLLQMSGLCKTIKEGEKRMREVIDDQSAYNKFLQMMTAQGGSKLAFPKTKYVYTVKAKTNGYVSKIHTLKLGTIACDLGAGRRIKEDVIDHSAGIVLTHKVNDKIHKGEILAYLYTNQGNRETCIQEVLTCFEIANALVVKEPLIYKLI